MRATVPGRDAPPVEGAVLVDCHTHLDRYPPARLAAMLARAATAGVGAVIAAGSDLASTRRAVALAAHDPRVRAGIGLHPLRVRGAVPERVYAALAALATTPGVVVWSECGLDYQAGTATPAEQRAAFHRQLVLARARGLAAIIHVVDATDDALAILADTDMASRAAIHYFVGGPALAERYLAAGLYLSVGKRVTRPEQAALREAVRLAPLDRLLLETDTYPLPGRTTEPGDVGLVAAAVAALRDVPVGAVAAATTANLARLLGPRFALDPA